MNTKTIHLAGGCFWGLEAYFERIPGVVDAVSGYANGKTKNPSYEDVSHRGTGHAETVKVTYDPERISLDDILRYYFRVVDPTSLNQQGNDRGVQYRSGVYYTAPAERATIEKAFAEEQKKHQKPLVVENLPLDNFYEAEEYHQDYLAKNPNGYCHIDIRKADIPLEKPAATAPAPAKTDANGETWSAANRSSALPTNSSPAAAGRASPSRSTARSSPNTTTPATTCTAPKSEAASRTPTSATSSRTARRTRAACATASTAPA